jgi:DNA-binding transcriptional ArsR family regulator
VTPANSAPTLRIDVISEVLAALADPTRRALYEQLLTSGAASATVLADGADISRQAIVKHLQILELAGLASSERRGREVVYVPASDGIITLSKWIDTNTSRWQRRADRLKKNIVTSR